jgi:LysR family nitrogen assimilation transcriptional regulator
MNIHRKDALRYYQICRNGMVNGGLRKPKGARMDLRQLEYFVNVVDLGGFSRAGRVLGIAQPAISRQIRSLEVELRQNLLLRNGRGATPTEAGKRLLEHARGILQQVDRARREVDEAKDAPVGHVVVGLPPTVSRHLTVPVVREFRQRFPGGSLAIVEGLSATIHEWLLVGRVDVGVVYNPVASPAVDARPLLEEQLCLIGPKRKGRGKVTLRLRDLPRYPLLIPSRPHAIRMLVETRLAGLGLRPQVAMEIDAVPAILELVAEGHGFAVLSPRALHGGEAARRLYARAIVQPRLTSKLAIATSAQRPSTPIQQRAIELIERLMGPALAVPRTG